MKRYLFSLICIGITFLSINNVFAISTTSAKEKIDISRKGSLTLNYNYDDYLFDNINVKIYKVASVTNDFQYQISPNFLEHPININGIIFKEEWNILENTLNSYIIADDIKEDSSHLVEDNTLRIENLEVGLYFIKTKTIDNKDYKLIFDDFLINIPNLDDDGYWDYDVNIYPKIEQYIPEYEKITYTVIKEWQDDSNNRPNQIEIEIYKDDVLMEKKTLSSLDNWKYSWDTIDDGSNWTVIERNIPDNYSVSIINKSNKFIIINKDSNYKEDNPKTIDNIKIYLYLLLGSFLGIIILIFSLILNRKKVE